MSLPPLLHGRLAIPAVVAPMFLTSGPDLVVECCRSGLVGTFPALNQRTTTGLAAWLDEISDRLAGEPTAAPYGVNLVVHRSNPRLAADLEVVVASRPAIVITSLGVIPDVIQAVHSYGGLVFHDVISRRHAEKAAGAGVDGIVAVCAGAGGHGGTLNPFPFVAEIRRGFGGAIILAGALNTGREIAAARMMGADLAYLGTRFLATRESQVSEAQKAMVVQARASDIVYTPDISGVSASFLRQSIAAAGIDPDNIPPHGSLDMQNEGKVWKSVWSAGQGVGGVEDVPAAASLCARLIADYREAMAAAASDPFLVSRSIADHRLDETVG